MAGFAHAADGWHKFRRQFPIGNFIVDFICLDARLIVEVDGGQHADETYGDTQRDEWLKSQNFRVLHHWNNQMLNELDGGATSKKNKKARISPGFFTLDTE